MNSNQTPKQVVIAERAPKAIGPYSAGILCQGFVFVSGQLGIDPENGNLLEGVEAQARQALRNLSAVLEAAHTDLNAVVKTTVFLKDMADFAVVNAPGGSPAQGRPGGNRSDCCRLPCLIIGASSLHQTL